MKIFAEDPQTEPTLLGQWLPMSNSLVVGIVSRQRKLPLASCTHPRIVTQTCLVGYSVFGVALA